MATCVGTNARIPAINSAAITHEASSHFLSTTVRSPRASTTQRQPTIQRLPKGAAPNAAGSSRRRHAELDDRWAAQPGTDRQLACPTSARERHIGTARVHTHPMTPALLRPPSSRPQPSEAAQRGRPQAAPSAQAPTVASQHPVRSKGYKRWLRRTRPRAVRPPARACSPRMRRAGRARRSLAARRSPCTPSRCNLAVSSAGVTLATG